MVNEHGISQAFFLQCCGALAQDVAAFRAILSDHGNRERNPEENPLLKWWGDLDILFSVKLPSCQVDFAGGCGDGGSGGALDQVWEDELIEKKQINP